LRTRRRSEAPAAPIEVSIIGLESPAVKNEVVDPLRALD
jgi:hypothetical protein